MARSDAGLFCGGWLGEWEGVSITTRQRDFPRGGPTAKVTAAGRRLVGGDRLERSLRVNGHGPSYAPQVPYAEVLTPSSSQCEGQGERLFLGVTVVNRGHCSGPQSNRTRVLINRGD